MSSGRPAARGILVVRVVDARERRDIEPGAAVLGSSVVALDDLAGVVAANLVSGGDSLGSHFGFGSVRGMRQPGADAPPSSPRRVELLIIRMMPPAAVPV